MWGTWTWEEMRACIVLMDVWELICACEYVRERIGHFNHTLSKHVKMYYSLHCKEVVDHCNHDLCDYGITPVTPFVHLFYPSDKLHDCTAKSGAVNWKNYWKIIPFFIVLLHVLFSLQIQIPISLPASC